MTCAVSTLIGWVVTQHAHAAHYRLFEVPDEPHRSRVELRVAGRSLTVKGLHDYDAFSNAAQVVTSDPLLESIDDEISALPKESE